VNHYEENTNFFALLYDKYLKQAIYHLTIQDNIFLTNEIYHVRDGLNENSISQLAPCYKKETNLALKLTVLIATLSIEGNICL